MHDNQPRGYEYNMCDWNWLRVTLTLITTTCEITMARRYALRDRESAYLLDIFEPLINNEHKSDFSQADE